MSDPTYDEVLFVALTAAPRPGEATLHSRSTDVLVRSLAETMDDWKRMFAQVTSMVGATDEQAASSGWTLDEIKVGLTFDARGRLAFIAEAGVEATIEATFKRPVPTGVKETHK